ncbi:MAG: peroxidase-related enzyme, partial [Chloroflexota bacterium]
MERLTAGISKDYQQLPLDRADRVMLEFAEKLTVNPDKMAATDIQKLRTAGFDDVAIHDIVEVVACFNYFNRLTSGLGVPL